MSLVLLHSVTSAYYKFAVLGLTYNLSVSFLKLSLRSITSCRQTICRRSPRDPTNAGYGRPVDMCAAQRAAFIFSSHPASLTTSSHVEASQRQRTHCTIPFSWRSMLHKWVSLLSGIQNQLLLSAERCLAEVESGRKSLHHAVWRATLRGIQLTFAW